MVVPKGKSHCLVVNAHGISPVGTGSGLALGFDVLVVSHLFASVPKTQKAVYLD